MAKPPRKFNARCAAKGGKKGVANSGLHPPEQKGGDTYGEKLARMVHAGD